MHYNKANKNYLKVPLLCSLILICGPAAITAHSTSPSRETVSHSIVQRGFEAFNRGKLGSSGANLYISRSGRIEVINTWDLNADGYNDAVFSNDHDVYETVDALIYWGSKSGYKSLLPDLWRERPLAQLAFGLMDHGSGITRLPAFGGGKSLLVDLNRDGFTDVVFCNYIHNYPGIRSAYIYWGSAKGFASAHRTELPTAWASGVAAGDLNGDGYPELVFANQGTEAGAEDIQQLKDTGSYIYWGSATGFELSKRTLVATHGARDVAIADINGDGKADLSFINNSPQGKDVQLFTDSAGYSNTKGVIIPLHDPTSICASDLDGDGYADLVITSAAPPQTIGSAGQRQETDSAKFILSVLRGGGDGISEQRVTKLPTLAGKYSSIGDFNHDGWLDLAVANNSDGKTKRVSSYVYWGSLNGFDEHKRTELPTLGANSVAYGDLNSDGYVDLVFANSSDDLTLDVPSYIYWGSSTGYAPYMRTNLQGFGVASVSVGDLNGDQHPEIILVNQYSGSEAEVNSHIYWGNAHHYYSTASMTSLPTHGAYGTTAADFNDDGLCDLIICNYYQEGSYLYWGNATGFSLEHRQTIGTGRYLASATADLNRDGFLDIVFTGNLDGKNVSEIIWGTEHGFDSKASTMLELATQRCGNINIADLNRDGQLDLVYNDDYFGRMQIFWGNSEAQYSHKNSWTRKTSGGGLGLADINGDGVLDFIIPGGFDPARLSPNTKTRVFLGTSDGTPALEPFVELEAYQSCEISICDLNRDGYLDLILGNYMSETTRSLPMFVYWGDKDGKYSESRRLDLPAESSCGIETLDLNRDGYPELIVHNHLKDGVHTLNSYIYWNGPSGFDKENRTELPNFGPHYTAMTDPGNLYTRKLEEYYVSSPLELPVGSRVAGATWKATEPHGAKLALQVRTAATAEELSTQGWQPVGNGTAEKVGRADDRWIQYRAVFHSPDASSWPALSEVDIHLR